MTDRPRVVLPALGGGQAASWAALIEIAPLLGGGGQSPSAPGPVTQ